MEISIYGIRTHVRDWDAVQGIPGEQLPPLNAGQKETARSLRIPEEDYARGVLAGDRTRKELQVKAERVAKLLAAMAGAKHADAVVEKVALDTWKECFEIEIRADGALLPVRVKEDLIDNLFERGSAEAEQGLSRILDLAFAYGTPLVEKNG